MAWSVRRTYWIVCFFGFASNYMIRVNLNIAITAMVNMRVHTNETIESECIPRGNISTLTMSETYAGNVSAMKLMLTKTDSMGFKQDRLFDWDSNKQNLVLGSFFWLHWSTQIPGGVLARTLGTKCVFGLSNLAMFLISLALPAAAYWDYRAIAALRILQGFFGGLAWPSMHNLVAHWIPPNERSQFITSYLGSSFGLALSYPLCGFLIDNFGWESSFYVTGLIGIFWYLVWLYVVYDTPKQHPRVTAEERTYIEEKLGNTVTSEKIPVPWLTILTSLPVWSTMLVQWGVGWGLHTLMTQGPSYLKYIFGWKPSMVGVWLGVPHLMRTGCAVLFSYAADKMLTANCFSVTVVRKIFVFIGSVLHGVLLLGIEFSNCDTNFVILFLTLSTAMTGASSAGHLALMIDLAPNFASVLQGFSGMLGVVPGFISPPIVAYFTNNNETMEQWNKVFILSAAVIALPGLLFILIGTAEIQPWNDPEYKKKPKTGNLNKALTIEEEKQQKTTKF